MTPRSTHASGGRPTPAATERLGGTAAREATLASELREELDRLRLENQQLRARLADARRPTTRIGGLASGVAHAARQAGRALSGRLRRFGATLQPSTEGPRPAAAAPYVVRRLREPTSPRPRVLHVIANFYLGGSARLVVDLVEHLDHRYEQSVVSWDVPPTPAYVGLPVDHLPAVDARRAEAELRSRRPDLVHVHYLAHHRDPYNARAWEWYRAWFAAAERLGLAVVENINIPTEPYVSESVRCYVHVSDYVRERFGRRDGRHVTIYPGSDLHRFARRGDDSAAEDCIGMAYRLQGDKVDERAVEPFVEVVRRRPGTRALIVGGGRLLEACQARVAASGLADAFTFTGYVAYEELPRLYARMSVFVAPVHRESFGQVSPFAMGMELPVVGYHVGALEEIVGDASLLAPPGDAEALADIIVALLDDPRRRRAIGLANRRRAEQRFSVEAMVASYRALYDELLPRGARAAGEASA